VTVSTQVSNELDRRVTEVAWAALTPLAFLERSADVWADRPAVREGERLLTYAEFHQRVCAFVGVLRDELEIEDGDRVATLLPNTGAMLEAHFAVPGAGGVLVPLNTRLAARDYAFILGHAEPKVVVADVGLRAPLDEALAQLGTGKPRVVWISEGSDCEYEHLLAAAVKVGLRRPRDENAILSINYTSGTTGKPKGVETTHRGAYLHSLGVVAESALTPRSAYLWTLPMFHCNGWAYPWAVTAMGAKHVPLRALDPELAWSAIRSEGITHLCAAPTVLSMLLAADGAAPAPQRVRLFVGGAPPSPSLIERAMQLNVEITHLYGLTETYGPLAVCAWNPAWDELQPDEQSSLRARQGVATVVTERLRVVDPNMRDVPRDGSTMGEVVMRGNNIMRGYYRDAEATLKAFEGGWFHSGDLGVVHEDGYIELRDRLKDVVISGGENISTIEVEQALVAHPNVDEAAVVAAPDDHWGEIPVAFVTTLADQMIESQEELREFARERLASFKIPKRIEVVSELPKTATGKIQKFELRKRAARR
jgi:fatty-acyl-CoA synthase